MRSTYILIRPCISTFALIAAACGWPTSNASLATDAADPDSALRFIVGTWTGTSTCVGNRPACKNETVVYRFVALDGHSDQVRLYADKILDGKRVAMGALVFEVDQARQTLRGEFTRGQTHGEWSYAVEGDALTGQLVILPERSVGRDVRARRASETEVAPAPPLSDYDE